MSSLQLPIRNHLREPSSESELHHVWKQIKELQKSGRASPPRSHISTLLISLGAVTLFFPPFFGLEPSFDLMHLEVFGHSERNLQSSLKDSSKANLGAYQECLAARAA